MRISKALLTNVSRRFALDNLTYEAVSEPATLLLLGTGLAGVGLTVRKKQK